jgi:biotin carboxyl carrier protein
VVLAGVITSAKSQVVAAEFEGRVEDVLVRGGQRVTAGQVLARLDDSQLRQRVESARQAANAARAEAARASIGVAEARRQLATEDRLYRSGAQSRQAVAAARASVSSSGAAAGAAFASARSSEAQVQELTEQLAKAEIKAPMDGVVTMIKVKPGEVAARGTRVARVFDPADLQVRFEVPRGHRAEFAVGAEVEVTLAGVDRPLRGDGHRPVGRSRGAAAVRGRRGRHRRRRAVARRRPGRGHGQRAAARRAGGRERRAMIPSARCTPAEPAVSSDVESPTWVTSHQAGLPGLAVRRSRLEVVSGPDAGLVLEFAQPTILIGRVGADLTLSDPKVSGCTASCGSRPRATGCATSSRPTAPTSRACG